MWSSRPSSLQPPSSPRRPKTSRPDASRGCPADTSSSTTTQPSLRDLLPFNGVSDDAIREATRSLAVMMRARLPLIDALKTTRAQTSDERLKDVFADVIQRVEGGQTLGDSLALHDDVFGGLYVHMVRVGEHAGILSDVLNQLATYLERRSNLKRRVRLAFVYPGLILTVALGATVFLLTVIVPTFADVFASFDTELPAVTQFVLTVSDVLRNHTLGIAAGVLAVGFGARAALTTPTGRRLRDTVALRAPLFGSLVRGAITARVCRTLGTLLSNGVGLVTALDIQRSAASNVHVRASLDTMAACVRRGDDLTSGMEQSDVFPEMVVRMIQAGEKTAELDTMLLRAAEHYEDNVDAVTDTLSSILEPVLIVFIGALIGGILIAIYLPMFNMINVVQ